MVRYMVWPGGHGMVCVMAWRGMAWYRVWPDGHYMVYDMALRAWHVIWHVMVYCMAWHGMAHRFFFLFFCFCSVVFFCSSIGTKLTSKRPTSHPRGHAKE